VLHCPLLSTCEYCDVPAIDTGVRGTLIIELRQAGSKSYVDMLHRSCEHNTPYASVVAFRAEKVCRLDNFFSPASLHTTSRHACGQPQDYITTISTSPLCDPSKATWLLGYRKSPKVIPIAVLSALETILADTSPTATRVVVCKPMRRPMRRNCTS
jgi:hypothetical protein